MATYFTEQEDKCFLCSNCLYVQEYNPDNSNWDVFFGDEKMVEAKHWHNSDLNSSIRLTLIDDKFRKELDRNDLEYWNVGPLKYQVGNYTIQCMRHRTMNNGKWEMLWFVYYNNKPIFYSNSGKEAIGDLFQYASLGILVGNV